MLWEADAPAYGFSPTGRSWLPQPKCWAAYALDQQRGRARSTYEMYRAALRLRLQLGLGRGELSWMDDQTRDVLIFQNRDVLVLTNFGPDPVPAPGPEVLLASGPLGTDGRVPTDTTIWVRTG